MNIEEDREKINVKDVYEVISAHFSNTRAYTWKWVDDFIKSFDTNSNILDVGCGNGRNMQHNNYNFIGIDNCDGFLNICREKKLNVLQANMCNIPLQDNMFDAIISIASFHHLCSHENRIRCLCELKRLIKNNGLIMISVWSINQPKKTKKTFTKYGDTIVEYNKFGKIYSRYYYIFKIDELYKLFSICKLNVVRYFYDCGNEIFILNK